VYWNNSPTKYSAMQEQAQNTKQKAPAQTAQKPVQPQQTEPLIDADTGRTIVAECDKRGINLLALLHLYKVMEVQELTVKQANNILSNWDKIKERCSI